VQTLLQPLVVLCEHTVTLQVQTVVGGSNSKDITHSGSIKAPTTVMRCLFLLLLSWQPSASNAPARKGVETCLYRATSPRCPCDEQCTPHSAAGSICKVHMLCCSMTNGTVAVCTAECCRCKGTYLQGQHNPSPSVCRRVWCSRARRLGCCSPAKHPAKLGSCADAAYRWDHHTDAAS
jgi:hypothetical protein